MNISSEHHITVVTTLDNGVTDYTEESTVYYGCFVINHKWPVLCVDDEGFPKCPDQCRFTK